MTSEEKLQRFLFLRMQLEVMVKLAESLDIEPFLADLERFDNIGWFVDPTAYRNTLARAELFGDLARAAQVFKTSALKFLEQALGRINPNELVIAENICEEINRYLREFLRDPVYPYRCTNQVDVYPYPNQDDSGKIEEIIDEDTDQDDDDPGISDPD